MSSRPAIESWSLQESEARLRAVVDTAVDGIITINAEGLIDTVNQAACRMFGFTAQELLGESVTVLMPEAASQPPLSLRCRLSAYSPGENYRHRPRA